MIEAVSQAYVANALAQAAPRPDARAAGAGAVSTWAVLGVAAVLLEPATRLGVHGAATIAAGLNTLQWVALVGLTLLFGYVEGWRGLQRRFVPAVVERAFEIARARQRAAHWLAPLHALGLFGGTRRTRARAWRGAALIAAAVVLVRALPEPWRGIVDAAIAVSLAWGVGALLARFCRDVQCGGTGER
jgi:hypothetical protein